VTLKLLHNAENDLKYAFFEWFCQTRSSVKSAEGTMTNYFRLLRGQGLSVFSVETFLFQRKEKALV
jgi:hypothetical protein